MCCWFDTSKPNTTLSLADKNLTAAKDCDLSVHPVPGTVDGQPNPDFKPSIMAHQPDGSLWVWFSGAKHTDPLQGPSYHLR
jgi:hypothetical protein